MPTGMIGFSLIVAAALGCPGSGWAGPQCVASAAFHQLASRAGEWSGAVTIEVPSCRRSKGRFALVTQLEAMNGRIEFAERSQDWTFDGHGAGQFVYVIEQQGEAVVTDAWVRSGVQCECLD